MLTLHEDSQFFHNCFSTAVRIGVALAGIRIAEHTHHFPFGLFGLAFVIVSTAPS
jgi:hypothetical protein